MGSLTCKGCSRMLWTRAGRQIDGRCRGTVRSGSFSLTTTPRGNIFVLLWLLASKTFCLYLQSFIDFQNKTKIKIILIPVCNGMSVSLWSYVFLILRSKKKDIPHLQLCSGVFCIVFSYMSCCWWRQWMWDVWSEVGPLPPSASPNSCTLWDEVKRGRKESRCVRRR